MKDTKEEKIIENGEVTSKAMQFVDKYGKVTLIAIIAIVVVILGYFGYKKFIQEPKAVEASESSYIAFDLFMNNQYQAALEGQDGAMGLNAIIDEFGSTPAGNTAKYCAGICELNLGNYQAAIDRFKSYSGKDSFTKYTAEMLMGDAYLELGNNEEAIAHYEKATKTNDEFIIAPAALQKMAIVYYNMGKFDEAAKALQTLKEKYPMSLEAPNSDANTDKYVGAIEAK